MTENECIYLCYQHRSCVIMAYTPDAFCILYGAKLDIPDYDKSIYMDYEKCHINHLLSCIYTYYVAHISDYKFYKMNNKVIQGSLTETVFEQVSSVNQTIFDQTTWIYYQYNSESESFCKEQCSLLQTCYLTAYHKQLFNGICFILITDSETISGSISTLERPTGDWKRIDFQHISFPPWDIKNHFNDIFNCFGIQPTFHLCENYPIDMNQAPNIPGYGYPITGVYTDINDIDSTIKVFPEYHRNDDDDFIPNYRKYFYFKWNEPMYPLISMSYWSTYFEDTSNTHNYIWTTNKWKSLPKKEFEIFQRNSGSNKYSFLIGPWVRQTNSNHLRRWDFESSVGCPIIFESDDVWNDPSDATSKRIVKIPGFANCDTTFRIELTPTSTATCTYEYAPLCGQHKCCKRDTEDIPDDKRIGIYQCVSIAGNFIMFLPHGAATKMMYQCTEEITATYIKTITLKDTLHRKPTNRRRMLQTDVTTKEYEQPNEITNVFKHQNLTSYLRGDKEIDRKRRMIYVTNDPAWNTIVTSVVSDCNNDDGYFYWIPHITEDACKELCFFSADNDETDRCSNIFYTKVSYFIGCFVILQGDETKWKHGANTNWIRMEYSDLMNTPFNIFQLKTVIKSGNNKIPKRNNWSDNLKNEQIEMQKICDNTYDDGECVLTNIQKPQVCIDANQNAIIEISYHCKLSDGSISLTRNIRDIIVKTENRKNIYINCVSEYSIKVDVETNELFVSTLLDHIPFKQDIFYLNHERENKYTIKRLQKNKLNGNVDCIVYDENLGIVKLHECTDPMFPDTYKLWLYWNDGTVSLDTVPYKYLTHNGQTLIVTTNFDDAVSWSFDGSFSGCKDEECMNSNAFKNTITFNTNSNTGFSTTMFDPLYRKNSIYINGRLMLSDTVFYNKNNVDYYDSLGIIASNMYFGRYIYKQLIDIYNIQDDYDWYKAKEIDYISGGNLVLINGG
eukprot:540671_1